MNFECFDDCFDYMDIIDGTMTIEELNELILNMDTNNN